MQVFIIGAAGGVGTPLTKILTERGDRVTGMHRKPEQAEKIAAAGGTPVEGDLITDSIAELGTKVFGHEVVVFSAGAHGTGVDQTTLIDGEGLEKAAAAAYEAGVQRFVLVSAFPEAGRGTETAESFEHYMRVKKAADVHLAGTELDWVIVRPGTLRDEPGDGLVTAGPAIPYGDVRRENVAAFIAELVHRPDVTRVIVELTDGDTPAAEAVDQLT